VEEELSALLTELDGLAHNAKSFFPGRVLLPRKKTYAVLDRINENLRRLSQADDARHGYETYRRAIAAVGGVDGLASQGSVGPSIWRIWFSDVSRKGLSRAIAELRAAMEPFTTDRN
jgi:hypothetical protein